MPPSNRTLIVLLGVLTTIMVGWVLHVGAGILQPLVIALLLASMLQPVVRGLARWKIPPVLTVILIVSMLFWGLARVGMILQYNIASFIYGTPDSPPIERMDPFGGEEAEALAKQSGGWDGILGGINDRVQASSMPKPMATYLISSLEEVDVQGFVSGVIGSGVEFMRSLTLVVIYMLFIFAEQAVFRRKILSVSGERRADTEKVLDTIGRGIQRYLGVKTITSFATGALCYFALRALDVPYSLLFAFLTFFLNYIPTFGSIIAGILPTVTALSTGSSWNTVVIIVTVYLTVNLVLGSYLEPKILGRELNLSPLVIIISVVVWAGLWGVVGTFLAVPLTAGLQIMLASRENTRPIAVMLSSGPPREERRRKS